MNWLASIEQGLTYDDFLRRYGTEDQQRRWSAVHAAIQLSGEQQTLLAGFKRSMKVLVLAGAWCGDCVHQCPIFDHFAQASPTIDLRFLDRDADEQIKTELSLCGGARVPVVVFLSEDGQEVGRYGDRTLARYRELAAEIAGATCPTGLVLPSPERLNAWTKEWLDQFERCQLILRTSPRLRAKHGD